MIVEILQDGDWRQYEVSDVESLGDAAYWAVRSLRPELTDDNHTYEAERLHEITVGDEKVQWRQVSVFHKPSGKYWFGVKYRKPVTAKGVEQ